MSIATRLSDRRGQWHVGEQAEAGGACSSEHCSCWSHAELCPSILRGVHPWDPLARPSVHPWWSRGHCAPAPPADVTSAWEGPVATHRRLPPARTKALLPLQPTLQSTYVRYYRKLTPLRNRYSQRCHRWLSQWKLTLQHPSKLVTLHHPISIKCLMYLWENMYLLITYEKTYLT